MKKRRRVMWVLVVVALGSVLGLGLRSANAKDVVVGAVTNLDNEYYSNWNVGAEQAAEALGLDYRAMVDNYSAARQMEIYEAQLQIGTKMFFGTSPFTGNIPQIAKKVKEKEAYYIGVWDSSPWLHPMEIGGLNYVCYFVPDDFNNAYVLAKAMFKKMGGRAILFTLVAGRALGSTRLGRLGWTRH